MVEREVQGEVADGGWTTGGVSGADEAVLTVIAGAQFSLRLSESMRSGGRHRRLDQARSILNDQAIDKLRQAGLHDKTLRLDVDNSDILRDGFSDGKRLGLVVTALLGNPIQPFEIRIYEKERLAAARAFAADLGCPKSWFPAIERAVQDALRSQSSFESVVLKVGMGVVGVAVIVAAPYLALAVAPAGLAGGAAFVAGLAALGPGGMLGGLAVVGAVAAGGGGVAATSLVTGNRRLVQQNVVFIESIALAKRELRPRPRSTDEWLTLTAMRSELETALGRHKRLDDRVSATARDITRKLDDIAKALGALEKEGMGDSDDGGPAGTRR